jgi:tetratricopeptide (TPR) repeat protein
MRTVKPYVINKDYRNKKLKTKRNILILSILLIFFWGEMVYYDQIMNYINDFIEKNFPTIQEYLTRSSSGLSKTSAGTMKFNPTTIVSPASNAPESTSNESNSNVKMLTQNGEYTGILESISDCKREIGDKRYCNYLDIKLDSGETVRSKFYLYVNIIRGNNKIYNGPDVNKSQVELHNALWAIVKENLIYGSKIRASYTCDSDAACLIREINILEKPDEIIKENDAVARESNFEKDDKALKNLDSAITQEPNSAEAYYKHGLAYYVKEEYDNAIEYFKKAIDGNPEYADAYRARGEAYSKKGHHVEAEKDFKKYRELTGKGNNNSWNLNL